VNLGRWAPAIIPLLRCRRVLADHVLCGLYTCRAPDIELYLMAVARLLGRHVNRRCKLVAVAVLLLIVLYYIIGGYRFTTVDDGPQYTVCLYCRVKNVK